MDNRNHRTAVQGNPGGVIQMANATVKPNGTDLLALLISLYAEQEGVHIKYELEEVHND